MTELNIYINYSLIDIFDSTVVAVSFTAFDIGQLSSRSANYTNKFKVPKTENNLTIYQHANDYRSFSNRSYSLLPAKIVQNGVEIVSNGVSLMSESEDHFSIEIYSGPFGFFDQVGDQTLQDLNLSAYDRYSGAPDPKTKTPFLDYGNFDPTETPTLSPSGGEAYSFPYKLLIEEIIHQNGYTETGPIFDNSLLANMYLSALGFTYNEKFTLPKNLTALIADGGVNTVGTAPSGTKVPFTNVVKDCNFYNGTNTYTVGYPEGSTYAGTYFIFKAKMHIEFTVNSVDVGGTTVTIQLLSSTTGTQQIIGYPVGGPYSLDLEISDLTIGYISGIFGGQVYAQFLTDVPGSDADITVHNGWLKIEAYNEVQQSNFISCTGIMPDMKQKDLIKDFAVRFGVLFSETRGVLQCKTFKEIINDRASAFDWTSKRDTSRPDKIINDFSGYGRVNSMSYTITDDDLATSDGEGIFDLDNENLTNEVDIYESPFNASKTESAGNQTAGYINDVTYIPAYDEDGDFTDPGLRLITIRDSRSSEPALTGGGSYQVAMCLSETYYFDVDYGLHFQRVIDLYYNEYVESLRKLRYIERYYILNENDIGALNLLKLMFDTDAYYLVVEVNNYVPGQPTKLKLLRV